MASENEEEQYKSFRENMRKRGMDEKRIEEKIRGVKASRKYLMSQGINIPDETTENEEQNEEQEERQQDIINDKHTSRILKNSIFKLASLPMKQENNKRDVFEGRLKDDEFLNKYVENKINTYCLITNPNLKAVLTYAYHYEKVYNSNV